MAANNQNYYDVLGVTSQATADDIRTAYRELVKKYHPDQYRDHPLQSVAEEKLQQVNEAYAVLSDEQKRRTYDQQNGFQNPFAQSAGSSAQGQSGWQQQTWQNGGNANGSGPFAYGSGPYYGGPDRGRGGCCDALCTLCVLDSCCECMGGDLCTCC